MIVFRIVDRRYQNDLSGKGAGLYGGRWNHVDEYVLYTTSNVSLACLELLVNVDLSFKKPDYVLLTIEIPDHFTSTSVTFDDLPKDWRSRDQYSRTKAIGSNWYKEQTDAALIVPSAVVPQERNYIFNVFHPLAKEIKIIQTEPFTFDARLLK